MLSSTTLTKNLTLSQLFLGTAPRMKRHRLQLVRIFITDIIVGLSPYRLMALLGLHHIDRYLIILLLLYSIFNFYFYYAADLRFLIFSNINNTVHKTTQIAVDIIQNAIAPFQPNLSTINPVPLADNAAPI